MASFSALGNDLSPIALIVLHSLEGSDLCFSFFTSCMQGYLRCSFVAGGISRSEVISYSYAFQYFRWGQFYIKPLLSRGYGVTYFSYLLWVVWLHLVVSHAITWCPPSQTVSMVHVNHKVKFSVIIHCHYELWYS